MLITVAKKSFGFDECVRHFFFFLTLYYKNSHLGEFLWHHVFLKHPKKSETMRQMFYVIPKQEILGNIQKWPRIPSILSQRNRKHCYANTASYVTYCFPLGWCRRCNQQQFMILWINQKMQEPIEPVIPVQQRKLQNEGMNLLLIGLRIKMKDRESMLPLKLLVKTVCFQLCPPVAVMTP